MPLRARLAGFAISKTSTTLSSGVCKFRHLSEFNALQHYAVESSASDPTVTTESGGQGAEKFDVPQFQYLMLPLLKVMGGEHEMTTIKCVMP